MLFSVLFIYKKPPPKQTHTQVTACEARMRTYCIYIIRSYKYTSNQHKGLEKKHPETFRVWIENCRNGETTRRLLEEVDHIRKQSSLCQE